MPRRECFRLVLSFDGDLPPMSIMQMCQKALGSDHGPRCLKLRLGGRLWLEPQHVFFFWWALPHLKGWLLSIDSLMVGEFSNVWESWCQELEMRAKSCQKMSNQRAEKSLKSLWRWLTMMQLLMFYWNPSESNMDKTSSFAFMNLLSRACWTRGRGEEDEWFW